MSKEIKYQAYDLWACDPTDLEMQKTAREIVNKVNTTLTEHGASAISHIYGTEE